MGSMHPEGSSGKGATLAYPQPWFTLLVLGPVFFGIADGCFRQNKAPPPTARPMLVVPEKEPTMTPPEHHNKFPCSAEEAFRTSCLNGGKCVAIEDFPGSRTATCHCPVEYWGSRCAEFKPLFDILGVRQERVRTAHIAAGLTVSVVVVFIVLLVVFVWLRKRSRQSNKHSSRTVHARFEEEGTTVALNGMGSEKQKEEMPQNGNTEKAIILESEHFISNQDLASDGHLDEKQPMNSTVHDSHEIVEEKV